MWSGQKEYSEEDIEQMRKMIIRMKRRREQYEAFKSNWEVDYYYETKYKQYDTE